MPLNGLFIEQLENRLLLASDVAVSANQISSTSEATTYEVSVTNLGETPVAIQLSQLSDPLQSSEWELDNPFPALIDLQTLFTGELSNTPWAKDGAYGHAIWGLKGDQTGGRIAAGDFNGDGIADAIVDTTTVDDLDRKQFVVFGNTDERPNSSVHQHLLEGGGFSFDVHDVFTWGVGDFNGDDVDDILVSLPDDGVAARSHIYFGHAEFDSLFDPDELDGSNGFTIFNTNSMEGFVHAALNVGDVNGDRIDDIVLKVANFDEELSEFAFVYGSESHSKTIDTIDLDGEDGFVWGQSIEPEQPEWSSYPVGDINGDGIADFYNGFLDRILFGMPDAERYLSVDDLPSSQFIDLPEKLLIQSLGDINGDGFEDIYTATVFDLVDRNVRILFGSEDGIDFDQSDALKLTHRSPFYSPLFGDSNGNRAAIASADLNGDGLADLIIADETGPPIGEEFDTEPPSEFKPGVVYVLYGSAEYPDEIDLRFDLNGDNGFAIQGFHGESKFGQSIAVGDFNGDGIEDFMAGAPFVSSPNNHSSGAAQIIHGQTTQVNGSGTIDSTVRLIPGKTITYTVEGQLPEDASDASVMFNVSLREGIEDPDPSNNSVTLDFSAVDTVLAGDVDNNGEVDFTDFLVLANNFGRDDDVVREDGDLDEDGVVSFLDFLILANNFGRSLA